MSKKEDTKKALKQSKADPIRELFQSKIDQLGKALPDGMSAQRLARIAETAIRITPKLSQCDPRTLLACVFQSAQLGLEPNVDGQCYYLPFWNSKRNCYEAQFIIGYKGYGTLFYNHESAVSLEWGVVKEGDSFKYEKGTESFLKHVYGEKRGEPLKYWVMAKLVSGGTVFEVMSREECIDHGKKHSKCYDRNKNKFRPGTPWDTASDMMCLKTVLIQLSKIIPKSVYIKKALSMDETTKFDVSSDMSEIPDKTNWDQIEDAEHEELSEPEHESGQDQSESAQTKPQKEKDNKGKKTKKEKKSSKKSNKKPEKEPDKKNEEKAEEKENIEDQELDDNQKRLREKAKDHGLHDEEDKEGLFDKEKEQEE